MFEALALVVFVVGATYFVVRKEAPANLSMGRDRYRAFRGPSMGRAITPRRPVESLSNPIADTSPLDILPADERAEIETILGRVPDLTAMELHTLEHASYRYPAAAALLQSVVRDVSPSYTFTGT
jgi:hypothetical protein